MMAAETLEMLKTSSRRNDDRSRFGDDVLKSYANRNADFVDRIPAIMKAQNKTNSIRAFLHHLPMSLCQSNSLMTVCLSSGSVSIGSHPHMDVCLRAISGDSCSAISPKHAVIYHDKWSNTFELLNYSEFGTRVDQCVYGLNVEADEEERGELEDEDEDFWSTSDSGGDYSSSSSACRCRREFKRRGRLIEAPAVLRHGSLVQIGCVRFLFVVVHDSPAVTLLRRRCRRRRRLSTQLQLPQQQQQRQRFLNESFNPILARLDTSKKDQSKRLRNNLNSGSHVKAAIEAAVVLSAASSGMKAKSHRNLVSRLIGESNKAALL